MCTIVENKNGWLPIDCLVYRRKYLIEGTCSTDVDAVHRRHGFQKGLTLFAGHWRIVETCFATFESASILDSCTEWKHVATGTSCRIMQVNSILHYCILFGMSLFPHEASVPDEQGMLPLHIAAATVDKNDRQSTHKIQKLVRMCPGAALVKTRTCRLPIALAVESGKRFQDVRALLEAAPETVATFNESTHMYPFMAAVEDNCKLATVSDPSRLQSGIPWICMHSCHLNIAMLGILMQGLSKIWSFKHCACLKLEVCLTCLEL